MENSMTFHGNVFRFLPDKDYPLITLAGYGEYTIDINPIQSKQLKEFIYNSAMGGNTLKIKSMIEDGTIPLVQDDSNKQS